MRAHWAVFAVLAAVFVSLLSGCSVPDPGPVTQTSGTVAPAATPSATADDQNPLPTATSAAVQSASPTSASPTSSPGQPPPATTPLPGFTLVTAPSATSASATPAPRDCIDQMVYLQDVTIPDNTMMKPGETFTKTWLIYNSGTCTWDESYHLAFAGGDPMGAPMENRIPKTAPGQKAEVSVRLTAPNRGGTHDSYWKMHNYAGQEFGAGYPPSIPLWAIINVNFFQVQANLQATASAQSAGEGSLLASKPLGTSAPAGSQPADNTSPEPAQSGGAGACNASEDPAVTSQIIELVNATREQNGLAALDVSGALSEAARLHSIDMACTQNASHTGSDGSTWSDRVAAQGYPRPRSSRENIFAGDPAMGATAQGVFDWWMSSQVHHDNMLWPDVAEIGVGYAYYNGEGYYTLIVAKP